MRADKLLAAAAGTALLLAVAVPSTASASHGPLAGSARFFDHINYQGSSLFLPTLGGCQEVPEYMDNVISSIDLDGAFVEIYDNDGCRGGSMATIRSDVPNLGGLSDRIESVRVF